MIRLDPPPEAEELREAFLSRTRGRGITEFDATLASVSAIDPSPTPGATP